MNCYPKTLLFRAENLSIKRQCPFSHFSLNLAKVSELLRVELVILNCLSTLNLGGIVQRFKKKWCFVLMVSKREDNGQSFRNKQNKQKKISCRNVRQVQGKKNYTNNIELRLGLLSHSLRAE